VAIEYTTRKHFFAVDGFAFLLIRKNASTAISDALMRSMWATVGIGEAGPRYVRREMKPGMVCAVWRDPADRIASAWAHYQRGLPGLEPGLSFDEFLASGDPHVAPQEPILARANRILRFDRLAEDWAALDAPFPLLPLERIN